MLIGPLVLAASPAGAAGEALLVHYESGADQLTLRSESVPLSNLLAHIAAAADMRIEMQPEADRQVNLPLQKRSLESSLRQLLRGLDYALFFAEAIPAMGRSGPTARLAALMVLPSEKSGMSGRSARQVQTARNRPDVLPVDVGVSSTHRHDKTQMRTMAKDTHRRAFPEANTRGAYGRPVSSATLEDIHSEIDAKIRQYWTELDD